MKSYKRTLLLAALLALIAMAVVTAKSADGGTGARFGVVIFVVYWIGRLFIRIVADGVELKRRREQRCIFCGYDLRASAVRCPACGKPMDGLGLTGIKRMD